MHEGQVADGMPCLDEATAAALAGEHEEIVAAGWTFCFLLNACERSAAADHAAQPVRRLDRRAAGGRRPRRDCRLPPRAGLPPREPGRAHTGASARPARGRCADARGGEVGATRRGRRRSSASSAPTTATWPGPRSSRCRRSNGSSARRTPTSSRKTSGRSPSTASRATTCDSPRSGCARRCRWRSRAAGGSRSRSTVT